MDHDRLRHLIDHPPRDPERAPSPAFTAAVMARVEPRPLVAPRQRALLVWFAVTLVAVVAALAPIDGVAVGDDLARWIDPELVLELGASALIVAAILALSTSPRRTTA
jgi:hypothetical protein